MVSGQRPPAMRAFGAVVVSTPLGSPDSIRLIEEPSDDDSEGSFLRSGQHNLATGVFFMCRRKQLQGFCCLCFGLGIMVGHALESWLLCSLGGLALIVLGLLVAKQR